jgi:predicted ABC-type ATPase
MLYRDSEGRSTMIRGKQALIIAGPNGAGKTTFAREYLPNEAQCPTFLNADEIAVAISPPAPELAAIAAGRQMIDRIDLLVQRGQSFAVETTLSGHIYVRRIPRWRASGYVVTLFFLSLNSAETCLARVAQRVELGGHSIPDDVVRRRFVAGRRNFERVYRNIVDAWALYDNSGAEPLLLDWGENGGTDQPS